MAIFVLHCLDKADSLPLRMATREAHLAYVAANRAKVKLAGPFLDAKGEMCGSMFVLDVADEAEARALNASDPYQLAGLFGEVRVTAWKVTVGELN